ncbi:ABC transporter, ATP-binding protein [Ectocarpus siliculosus]|uniref:ABC transporter, ATP-binding protein n=1 Tax=Ectocarpus siliculosus TaxID=2880 RepID=D7FVB1_ECTSI|nr:ABC transporter, ATP-binding protein [Ectocarpus siliculosus]|eukprot:CBJ26283.1 ABC transporter, ATP-binding protein [Ectocarpus siliculosus]
MQSSPAVDDEVANPTFGYTGGAMVVLNQCVVSQGDTELMSNVDLTVMPGDRVGLVGQNGAGKSTLLQCIAGYRPMDEGSCVVKTGARMGYLQQKGVSGSSRTVYEEACSEMDTINQAHAAMERAEAKVIEDPMNQKALDRLLQAQATYEAVGGLTQDRLVAQILGGLGFSAQDQQRLCSTFSGGWQMRIALAKLLLSEPDLLLLDEPTNHLDAAAKTWLGRFLSNYQGTIVTVSHDEALLEGIKLSTVAEVANQRVEVFKGCGFKKFLFERDERMRALKSKYEAEQKEMARLQGFVDRFGAQATKASAAQSRVKMLQKMEANATPLPEGKSSFRAKMRLPTPPACHTNQIELKGASFGWGDAPPTATGVNLKLEKGQTLAILGPNGAGKSTLLKALAGILPLSAGERKEGEGLKIGVFTQDLAQDLPQDAIALELVLDRVREHDTTVSDEQARTILGSLGLQGPKALRKIGVLSGGEKARVALAIFVMIPYNLLMLDEPSNHLDAETLNSLVDAIKGWKGTVVVVSHNKDFVTRLSTTHTSIVEGGEVKFLDRPPRASDWEHDAEGQGWKGGDAESKKELTPAEKKAQKALRAAAEKERKKKVNAPGRISKIEALVEELDSKISALTDEMYEEGIDAATVARIVKDKDAAEARSAKLYAEWEELEELLAED